MGKIGDKQIMAKSLRRSAKKLVNNPGYKMKRSHGKQIFYSGNFERSVYFDP